VEYFQPEGVKAAFRAYTARKGLARIGTLVGVVAEISTTSSTFQSPKPTY